MIHLALLIYWLLAIGWAVGRSGFDEFEFEFEFEFEEFGVRGAPRSSGF